MIFFSVVQSGSIADRTAASVILLQKLPVAVSADCVEHEVTSTRAAMLSGRIIGWCSIRLLANCGELNESAGGKLIASSRRGGGLHGALEIPGGSPSPSRDRPA